MRLEWEARIDSLLLSLASHLPGSLETLRSTAVLRPSYRKVKQDHDRNTEDGLMSPWSLIGRLVISSGMGRRITVINY